MANPIILPSSKALSKNPTELLVGSSATTHSRISSSGSRSFEGNGKWVLLSSLRYVGKKRKLVFQGTRYGPKYGGRSSCCCSSSAGEVGIMGCVGEEKEEDGYLASGFGWGVRRLIEVENEMRSVAYVQAEAFHVPMALFDDFLFWFFQAEVLSALMYRLRTSEQDRYACLVAELINNSGLLSTRHQGPVGAVDVTALNDNDVLRHLEGEDEYLYVSGMAVLKDYRRRKVASLLLKACDALSNEWGIENLALRAYEDDIAARNLYSNAGYEVVSRDPTWMTWIGRRRRVLMIKSRRERSDYALDQQT